MSDDQKMSRLISRSLVRDLDPAESAEIEKHIVENGESRKFAELSQLIQKSVSGSQPASPPSSAPQQKLSQESRLRLKRSVSEAVQEKLSQVQPKQSAQTADRSRNLATSATDPSPPLATVGSSEPPIKKRESIGRFSLIQQIRNDVFSNLWIARDEPLGRSVSVIELSSPALDSPQSWALIKRDAEIMAYLEHPNIPPVYQSGVDRKTGEPFIALRLIRERTLTDEIAALDAGTDQTSPFESEFDPLLTALLDTGRAVAFAHSQGVIHGSLGTDCVTRDHFGRTMVLNWGLANVTGQSGFSRRTVDGRNSLMFLAPEQAGSDDRTADERTDVYRLGAILFSILTGKAPHALTIERAPDESSARSQIAQGATPRSYAADSAPSDWHTICDQAMAFEPSQRFASVERMVNAIESCIAKCQSN